MREDITIAENRQDDAWISFTYTETKARSSSNGHYTKVNPLSIGAIVHWLSIYGLQSAFQTTISGDDETGEVQIWNWGNMIATGVYDEKYDLWVFRFKKGYEFVEQVQTYYIQCLDRIYNRDLQFIGKCCFTWRFCSEKVERYLDGLTEWEKGRAMEYSKEYGEKITS